MEKVLLWFLYTLLPTQLERKIEKNHNPNAEIHNILNVTFNKTKYLVSRARLLLPKQHRVWRSRVHCCTSFSSTFLRRNLAFFSCAVRFADIFFFRLTLRNRLSMKNRSLAKSKICQVLEAQNYAKSFAAAAPFLQVSACACATCNMARELYNSNNNSEAELIQECSSLTSHTV